jgi:PhzF family phenazine biosynthesis protein
MLRRRVRMDYPLRKEVPMAIPLLHVDAFTDRPFAGNPAAVCLLRAPAPDSWMCALAAEMNLSETAFPLPEGDGYRLRWFTPTVEIDLCGHATVATAHVLWETGQAPRSSVLKFQSKSGPLTARPVDGWVELDFPARVSQAATAPADLARALGVRPTHVEGLGKDYLVEVESAAEVRSARPDHGLLSRLDRPCAILTSRSDDPRYDFISRYFAPGVGIPEDPVTGSAHCLLGPYWKGKLGKAEFLAYQASARGGVVGVTVRGERVLLRGQAVTVFRTEISGP